MTLLYELQEKLRTGKIWDSRGGWSILKVGTSNVQLRLYIHIFHRNHYFIEKWTAIFPKTALDNHGQ